MNAVELNLEICRVLGIEDPGTITSLSLTVESGKAPHLVVTRMVRRLGEPGAALKSRSFDMVPTGPSRPGFSRARADGLVDMTAIGATTRVLIERPMDALYGVSFKRGPA